MLLLGADPNKRSWKRGSSRTSSMSPIVSVCVAYGHAPCVRSALISELIICGADPSVDRLWFSSPAAAAAAGNNATTGLPPAHCVSRRLDERTRRTLAELCVGPRRLQTMCCCVIRKCLALAQVNGVVKNADRLPLPSSVKAILKLELANM